MIVTAPTGVAAINAGGVTLHSFFQMPFGPIMPGYELQGRQRRFNKEKINIIKSLDLLVIDEISMVRADLLDGIDAVLRRFKHHDLPFGGVQLLMIGDLHQLSPVVKDDEWNILKNHYETFYFFSSHALAKTDMVSIELKHIYRQSDAKFIALLNRVRNNEIDQPTLDLLNSRYVPGFKPDEVGDYITLSTHNQSADQINQSQLKQLESKTFTLQAIIKGQYPEHSYPTAEKLVLKKGAQVMFVRNDSSPEKQYFNGKIGTVTHIGSETISVKCPDDNDIIQVEPICWENIKYTIEEKTKEISEDVIGEFIQYPLRLAWAITIHKSQGLTFERAIIDANAAFSHGQVYVALSRCKTFEGMVLSTRISTAAIKTDTTVAKFVDDASQHPPTSQQLETAKNDYQQQLLLECFNFNQLRTSLNKLLGILQSNQKAVQISDRENLAEFRKQTTDELFVVSDKFQRQLLSLLAKETMPQDSEIIQERARKASVYFTQKLQQGLLQWLNNFHFDTNNQQLKKSLQQLIHGLQHILAIKLAGIKSCQQQFSSSVYLQAIAKAEIESDSHTSSRKKPQKKKSDQNSDTKAASYRLYKEGKSIEQIAKKRMLKANTIETHLAYYIGLGKLDVAGLVSSEKIQAIEKAFAASGTESLSLIKEQLGEGYTYGELVMVRASFQITGSTE